MKVFVIYDSKYGNTKQAAEKILEGIKGSSGIETSIGNIKDIELEKVAEYNALVLGMPNHMGRPSRAMANFVNMLAKKNLTAKKVAVFGTYSGKVRNDRAVKKLENMVQKTLPNLKLILPGLSVRVKGIPGPIVEEELPRCLDFGKKIANELKGF